jgi:hypothetical protein
MSLSSSRAVGILFAAFILATGWLVTDYMPPPWPCDYGALARHPKARALVSAAQAACAGDAGTAELDLDRVWPDGWRRVHLFGPYHGNHEVLFRLGLEPAIMACTRSHNADEWTQAVVERADGRLAYFDLPSHLLAGPPRALAAGAGRIVVTCAAAPRPAHPPP